ncbi:MAG: MASE1 domain-containing protein [Elusimicrobiota bacterium]
MQKTLSKSIGGKGSAVVLVAAVYYVLARAGLAVALRGTAASPIWPASGFALAAVILFGPEAGAGVLLGAWLSNFLALAADRPGAVASVAAAVIAVGSAAQALAGARLLRRFLAERRPLESSRDVLFFAALTPVICLIGASVGTAALVALGITNPELFGQSWLTWWIGDVVGVLIVSPLALAWYPRAPDEEEDAPSSADAARTAAAMALVALSVWIGFGAFRREAQYPLSFLPFPILVWTSLRRGPRGVTAAAALLAAMVHWCALRGAGPFVANSTRVESLAFSSVYIAAAALTSYLIRALMSDLGRARAALERRVTEKDGDLWTANATLRVAALGRQQDGQRIRLYKHLVDELPVGIVVLRLDDPADVRSLRIVEMNPAGLKLAEASDPAEGQSLLAFAPEVFTTDLPRLCAESIRSGAASLLPDFVSRERVPGAHFSIKIFPLGGPLVGLVVENITAQKAAQDALSRSNADLTQFAYVASHDLQEPLRKASAFAEQIALHMAGRLDETDRDFFARLRRALDGMQKLIDGLLTLARVSASEAPARSVDLSALAADVVDGLDVALAESGGTIDLGKLPTVMADPQQMRQLLHNLIGNAIKFRRADRSPNVQVLGRTRDDGRCELVVADDGVGFDMKFAERLFQPFQRLHSRKDFPGSGMGLAICQRIVARHGGTISVDSAPDRGTRFTVVLPSGNPSASPDAAAVGGASWNNE